MLRVDPLQGVPARAAHIALTVGEKALTIQTNARIEEVERMRRDTRHKVLPQKQ
jgi:hypothetical protein